MQDAIFKIPILNSCQVEDPDPESQYFVVSAPASSCQESFNSEAVCSSDTTVLTLEAKTEDVKKVWLREIRRKTERRSWFQTRLTGGEEEGASQQVLVMLMLIAHGCDGNPC